MPTVVSDAGPPHYLILIEAIELLPCLFGSVVIPDVVAAELSHPRTPAAVRSWLASPPSWLISFPVPAGSILQFPKLDDGERDAIALAQDLGAELILMDDRAGASAARSVGLTVTGTLGVLVRAADLRLINLAEVVTRLKMTNFRCRPSLLEKLVAQHHGTGEAR